MKKFFGALLIMLSIIFSANISHAAKPVLLADITAAELFANIGYDVDCSYWERTRDGKQLFAAILPEDALITPRDDANIEVYAESRKGKVVEVVLYLKANVDTAAQSEMLARVFKALDEKIFQENQAAINRSVDEFLTSQTQYATIQIDTRQYILSKEPDGKTLIVSIKPAVKQNS